MAARDAAPCSQVRRVVMKQVLPEAGRRPGARPALTRKRAVAALLFLSAQTGKAALSACLTAFLGYLVAFRVPGSSLQKFSARSAAGEGYGQMDGMVKHMFLGGSARCERALCRGDASPPRTVARVPPDLCESDFGCHGHSPGPYLTEAGQHKGREEKPPPR